MHPLWYSPLLPVLFYASAIATGLAMTIFESWHSSKSFGRALEFPLIQKMTRVLAVVIAVYLTMRFLDLHHRGALATLNQPGAERWLFGLEIVLMAVPMLMFFRERTRENPVAIYVGVVLFLLGFVTHRLNVSVTAVERALGVQYLPKWTELSVTLAMVAAGFFIFRMAARHLPIFEHEGHEESEAKVPVLGTAYAPAGKGE